MSVLYPSRTLVRGNNENQENVALPVILSDVPLSFWGGIDPETGIVIDQSHPLQGLCVSDSILCIPSGRGSCTASQVLLELILNKKAPKALVLRDRDGLLCVGALIAQSVFNNNGIKEGDDDITVLDIIQLIDYSKIITTKPKYGRILCDGRIIFGNEKDCIHKMAQQVVLSSSLLFQKDDADGKSKQKIKKDNNSGDFIMNQITLTEEERFMFNSAETDAERRAIRCIIHYAHIVSSSDHNNNYTSNLRQYIDVDNAHIDGCTYIGPGGLKFVQRLVRDGGQVRIPTTLNSVSTDLHNWEKFGIKATRSQQSSIELANSYLALGCSEQSFTCAPYLLDNPPKKGQQIVWGESNAVVYANSVLGARTEKYADYLDICCAIVGKVPAVGVHLEINRRPQILLDVRHLNFFTDKMNEGDTFSLLFPVLGHLCGSLSDGKVPLLIGLESYVDEITNDHMKTFCAAFGTTGTSPLIHVAGITPEALHHLDEMVNQICERKHQRITLNQLRNTFRILDQHSDEGGKYQEGEGRTDEIIDLIAIGNPHLSLSECDNLVQLVESLPCPSEKRRKKRKSDSVRIIACISRVLYKQSTTSISILKDFGIEFVQDTCWCMLLEPPMIPCDPNAKILTNSGKYAHYGPGLTGRKFRLGTTAECIQAAFSGKLTRRSPFKFPWTTKQTRSYSCQHGTSINWRSSRYETSIMNLVTHRNFCRATQLFRNISKRIPF